MLADAFSACLGCGRALFVTLSAGSSHENRPAVVSGRKTQAAVRRKSCPRYPALDLVWIDVSKQQLQKGIKSILLRYVNINLNKG